MKYLETGTLEEKVLKTVQKKYPVTVNDIALELRVPRRRILMSLKKLQLMGLVDLEPLPDKIFVRCTEVGAGFVGINKSQQKKVKNIPSKKRGGKEPKKPKNGFDPMYA